MDIYDDGDDSSFESSSLSSTSFTEESYDYLMSELQLQPEKNWIPDDIKTTNVKEDEITFIHSQSEKPEAYPLRLATITLNVVMDVLFNLKVMGLHLRTNNEILAVKCEQVRHMGQNGISINTRPPPKKKKKKNKGRKDQSDFYNQSTIIVKPVQLEKKGSGKKRNEVELNLKFFNNGKIGLTGVKKISDADMAIKTALNALSSLRGSALYYPKKVEWGNPKNFKKKLKQRQLVLEYISEHTTYNVDWQEFIDGILTVSKDPTTGQKPYPNGIIIPENVGHNLTFFEILATYFDFDFLKTDKNPKKRVNEILNLPSFGKWFTLISRSYRLNDEPLSLEETQITIDYLAADKNRKIPMDKICMYLQTEYRENYRNIGTILRFYFWRNSDLKWEKIQHFFSTDETKIYNSLRLDKINVGKWDAMFNPLEVKLLFTYFSQLTKKRAGVSEIRDSDSESDEIDDSEPYDYFRDQLRNAARFFLEDLPVWSNPHGETSHSLIDCYSDDRIFISNINTVFRINYNLDKSLLKDVLKATYGEHNIFNEDSYGGMKLEFLTNIDCPEHRELDRRGELSQLKITPEYGDCRCKDVSVLIFPSVVLITGGRSFRQILHAYHFIKNVLLTDFAEILSRSNNQTSPLDKYPNIVSTDKHIYLKKKFVLDNPRNQFILGKTQLNEIFSKIDQRALF